MARMVPKVLVITTVVLASAITVAGPSAAATRADAGTVTITLQPDTGGNRLEPNYVGLSTEAAMLSDNDFGLPNLANYMDALNPSGVLRIGGVSADTTFWTSSGETPPDWSTGTITPDSLTALANVLNASGWSTILTVNLMHNDPARAADEASFAAQILGPALQAIAIGNEFDSYYSSTSQFFTDFESYVDAIHNAVPQVSIVGPDAAYFPRVFPDFVTNESPHPDIAELTNHWYGLQLDSCTSPTSPLPTAADLLSTDTDNRATWAASTTVTDAWRLGARPAITEANSIDCGGVPGVSNTFTSALWALNYSLLLAQNGVINVDFHGGFTDCGSYGVLCTGGTGTTLTAHPVFYGMLAVGLLGTGNFLQLTNSDTTNDIRAYAILNGSRLTMALLDVRTDSTTDPTTVTVDLGGSYTAAQEAELASPGGLSATDGITLGGQQVAAEGTFPTPNYTPVDINGQSITVSLDPDSAMLIQLG